MALDPRLIDIEKNLELLYEKLSAMERDRIMAYDAEAKISIEQRIRESVLPQIRRSETQYWQRLAQEANSLTINEIDANNAVIEIAEIIDQSSDGQYPDQMIQLLTEIRNKLNEEGKASSAKLKAALPLLPPFLSYEVELETQGMLRRMFLILSRLLKKTGKK